MVGMIEFSGVGQYVAPVGCMLFETCCKTWLPCCCSCILELLQMIVIQEQTEIFSGLPALIVTLLWAMRIRALQVCSSD